MPLSSDECVRYARQTILPEVGIAGQEKLKNARVLVVGAGGLGSPVCLYLAAAGVGRLGIVDADRVDEGNLQRQVIHDTPGVGRNKAESARDAVAALNPHVQVDVHSKWLDGENVDGLLSRYDVAVGCVDNFDARYILDAACVRQGKTHVYGSISQFEGQASLFRAGGPCYRCFFRDPPPAGWRPRPEVNGVLGTVAGTVGCIQANETIKHIVGIGNGLAGRLLLFDALAMRFREIRIKPNPDCPVCGGIR